MTRLLDAYADVLPYGLHPTPFGEVWRALQLVASTVWDVDPAVYRAGIAWGWYVQRNPSALVSQRDLIIAALISEQAPLIKADQTTAELVEYLRQWREYRPTYDRLEALYKLFAADVEILPISTPDAPAVSDTRLAFYVRIYGVDFSRLLTLDEAYMIAIRATPLGSRPIVYYEFEEQLSVDTQPLKAGIASIDYENDAICEPVELNNYTFIVADATTGQIVSGFSNELVYGEIEGIVLQSPRLVYGVDISVPTAQFWFTNNGRDETENTEIQANSTVTVYDENGGAITNEDTIGMYDTASVLAYMQANGDMVSKQDDVLIDYNGELGLQVDSGPISAWSVFAERVFTLSFANTQLPGITITMPADETGYKGTSITLPTMTGEYESGGKTWTPSAWDVGAFGSSYTLNADTVAHLIFEEVQYKEITLYMASGRKEAQTDISSGFSGNVDPTYTYPLYYDSSLTDPFAYDYSKDYEVGYYSSSTGEWVRYTVQSVSDMPSSGSTMGRILLDTGALWLITNSASSSITSTSITVRIYPKDQQYYAFYSKANDAYSNVSVSSGSYIPLSGTPGLSSGVTVPWDVTDNALPIRTISAVLGSAGNEIQLSDVGWYATGNYFRIANNVASSLSIRTVVFTLSQPTLYCYSSADKSTNNRVDYTTYVDLYDEDGNELKYDDSVSYRVIGAFSNIGNAASNSWTNVVSALRISKKSNGNARLGINNNQSVSVAKVWYIKTPISQ